MVVMPALFVFAAHAAVELVRRWRAAFSDTRSRRPAFIATALFLVFFVFVNVPVRSTAETWGYRLASALGIPTRLETSASGHFNIAVTFAALAKSSDDSERWLSQAEGELRRAIELEPRYAESFIELGKVLARQGRTQEAIEVYRHAAGMEPLNYRIHHSLGLLHRRLNDLRAAEAALRRALEVQPRHTASATRLGEVLLEQDRPEEAAEMFRYALTLRPDDDAARRGLATAASR
jgi:tetratricopeptide (TPR) repeat protein